MTDPRVKGLDLEPIRKRYDRARRQYAGNRIVDMRPALRDIPIMIAEVERLRTMLTESGAFAVERGS
jgi:hypothetical protein